VGAEARPDLLLSSRQAEDMAIPGPGAVMVLNEARLAHLTGRDDLSKRANQDCAALLGSIQHSLPPYATLLLALDFCAREPLEIVLAGDLAAGPGAALLKGVRTAFLPARVIAHAGGPDGTRAAKLIPLLEGRDLPGPPAVYVCRQRVCKLPVHDPAALAAQLMPGAR